MTSSRFCCWCVLDAACSAADCCPCLSAGQGGLIAGVCAALSTLLVVVVIVVALLCCRKNQADNFASKR